jgi:hypothetical protein
MSGGRRPLPSEQMPPFLDELRRWFEVYSDAGGRRGIRVQFTDGPPELPMRSALITAQGAAAIGQLTLWESGRCDTEAHATRDRTPILLRSRVLDEPARVPAIADDLVDHVADYSNS